MQDHVSPDGAWVIYYTTSGLRSVPAAGGDSIQLDAHSPSYPVITADSGRVVYTRQTSFAESTTIKSAPIMGGPAVELTAHADYTGPYTFRLTPDGTSV